MTDALPPDDLDVLAAAILDGDADDAVLARLDHDPDLRRRVEAQRRAREALRTPVAPLPATDVDAMIARALEVGPAPSAADGSDVTIRHKDPGGAPVTPLPRRRGGSSAPRRDGYGAGGRSVGPWLVAAAVVLVLAVAAVAVPLSRGERSDDNAATAVSGDSSSGPGGANSSSALSGPVTGRAESSVGSDLGTGTAEELAGAALDRVTGAPASPSTPNDVDAASPSAPLAGGGAAADTANEAGAAPGECAAALFPGAPVLFLGRGEVDGAAVDVVVVGPIPGTASAPTAAVLGPGCTVLARRTT